MMPPLGKPQTSTAHLVITLDANTLAIKRVGIYSAPAHLLTAHLRDEVLFDGHSVEAPTYDQARKELLGILRSLPNHKRLLELLSP